ncbi:sigma 54-interacting transcriptional regulator [Chitinophaga sp. CF418]|uniref:sigma-54 dependent transcriptional regulator n=1 Tax=Chitinophaga sp. CF418 TaxID=1855287 RepID=UPI000915DAF1|nr:sigma 54-interacting transcriptional regulator [Chitinophaga sp. CF418]SHL94071.1 Transcriptional regulator containing GAF, AAA-type ATPase, and DNA-binding Fis domains [Chitinophaga sp. CF418]
MKEHVLIVEDEYVLANDLRLLLEQAGYRVCAIEDTIAGARKAVLQHRPSWVLLDILLQDDAMGTDLAAFLTEQNVGFIYISASTDQRILEIAKQTQPDGFLVKPVRERDLLMMLDIARNKHKQHLEVASQRELSVQHQLQQLVENNFRLEQALTLMPSIFQALVPFDFMGYELLFPGTHLTKGNNFVRVGFNEYQLAGKQELVTMLGKGRTLQRQSLQPSVASHIYNHTAFSRLAKKDGLELALHERFDINACLQYVISLGKIDVVLTFYSKRPDAYMARHLSLLDSVRKGLTALFNKIQAANGSFATGSKKAPELTAASSRFEGLLGKSPRLLHVLDEIETVANTPVSVLVLGESGTGKELVARNIHQLSSRQGRPFVVVNCANLPAELIESELFGHEKGAFTGAYDKRTGKFEQADSGTLFLDEIGEMPLALQGKLLRVLQEKELEHVGGNNVVKVDVRIIAATNKHLEKEVAEGRFRLDLFFRLNVFPLTLPALRERKEDIPLLSTAFLEQAASRMGRLPAPTLSTDAIRKLKAYQWPGNIRELENLMERLVIKCRNPLITETDLPELKNKPLPGDGPDQTLSGKEAEYIISVLKKCNGKIFGNGGAAEILGLPPSTLTSRIKKLGIKKDLYFKG